jgi:hypothetical protein
MKQKIYMKQKIRFAAIASLTVAAGLALYACQEEFLKPDPLSFFEPEVTFSTKSGLEAALAMADRHMRVMTIHHAPPGAGVPIGGGDHAFTDVMIFSKTDEALQSRDLVSQLSPNNGRHGAASGTGQRNFIAYAWEEAYKGLKYCNSIPTYIDRVELDEATKNDFLGRSYFHRAFKYYNLVWQHGDIPFITKIPSIPKFSYRSTKKEAILEKLVLDMEFAVQHVANQVDVGRVGTVNKGACRMLLAKLYLSVGRYEDAKNQMNELIDNGGYTLMRTAPDNDLHILPNTEQTWKITQNVIWWLHRPENKGVAANTEAILVLPNQGATASVIAGVNTMRVFVPFYNGEPGNGLTNPVTPARAVQCYPRSNTTAYRANMDYTRAFGRGIGICRTSVWYENEAWEVNGTFDNSDLRRSSAVGNWVVMDSLRYNDPTLPTIFGQRIRKFDGDRLLATNYIRCWYGWPHYKIFVQDLAKDEVQTSTNYDGGVRGSCGDIYTYRLAEAYLIRAEAKFYLGDEAGAAQDVNIIRQRAGCTQTYTTVGIGDIMDERARELYMEEWRLVELKRVSHCLAMSGKPDEWGNTYNLADYDKQQGTDASGGSYYYQRATKKGMWNSGPYRTPAPWGTYSYVLGKHNHYWPIPAATIIANNKAEIAQNYGYDGYDPATPKWQTWQEAVADEDNK